MQERVVLEELNRDLSAAQARVERWAQSKISSAAELKEKHAVNVESLRGDQTASCILKLSTGTCQATFPLVGRSWYD